MARDERTAAKTLAGLEVERQQGEEELAKARAAENQTKHDAEAAAAAIAQLQREHAAAHAAQGVGPGDGCPICKQTIPAGFKPPRVPAERAANKADEEARRAETAARDVRVKLVERCRQLSETIDQARTTSQTASRTANSALQGLRTALGDAEADPSLSDTALLEALTTRAHEQEAATTTARGEAESARLALARREAALQPRLDALEKRHQALERSKARHAEQVEALEAERLTLPERFRPAANASADRIDSLVARLHKRLDEVRGIGREREEIQKRFAKLRSSRNGLAERRQKDFEDPRRRLEKAVLVLHAQVRDAADLAFCKAPCCRSWTSTSGHSSKLS